MHVWWWSGDLLPGPGHVPKATYSFSYGNTVSITYVSLDMLDADVSPQPGNVPQIPEAVS